MGHNLHHWHIFSIPPIIYDFSIIISQLNYYSSLVTVFDEVVLLVLKKTFCRGEDVLVGYYGSTANIKIGSIRILIIEFMIPVSVPCVR